MRRRSDVGKQFGSLAQQGRELMLRLVA